MASTLALPSIQPQNWASLKNSTGIPLDFLNTNMDDLEDEDEDEDEIDTLSKNRKNRNRKNRGGKKSNKKSKNKKIKFGTLPVVVSPGEF